MAIVVFDTFTDVAGTDLANHLPVIGAQWVEHPQTTAGELWISSEGRVYGDPAGTSIYLNLATLPTPNYEVSCVIRVLTHDGEFGLFGRALLDELTGVFLGYRAGFGWILAEMNQGGLPVFEVVPEIISPNTDYHLRIVLDGQNVYAYVNDTFLASIETSLLHAGYSGITIQNGSPTSGIHIDDFVVTAEIPGEIVDGAGVVAGEGVVAVLPVTTRNAVAFIESEVVGVGAGARDLKNNGSAEIQVVASSVSNRDIAAFADGDGLVSVTAASVTAADVLVSAGVVVEAAVSASALLQRLGVGMVSTEATAQVAGGVVVSGFATVQAEVGVSANMDIRLGRIGGVFAAYQWPDKATLPEQRHFGRAARIIQ